MLNKADIVKSIALALAVASMTVNEVHAQAARRDDGGSARVINKLQAMVREMTAERDALKSENETLAAEIETLKEQHEAAVSREEKLSGELDTQKSTNEAVRGRLDQTHEKLVEVVEKYKVLNQAKNQLSLEHAELQKLQEFTVSELDSCEDKNIKMYQATRDMLKDYGGQSLWARLVQAEPVFQFKSVELENIIQEYEDKLIEQKYRRKTEPEDVYEESEGAEDAEVSAPEPEEAQEMDEMESQEDGG
ncbi:hypothetical protein [Methylotuvimicrobium sp. KM1]|uniref:hypothetical protein n=1 Tax=Methylotuvimicrobium sp. KM1 TaxID=3377707 RepID=UPI003850B9E6